MGLVEIQVDPLASNDPLYSHMDKSFKAISVHKQYTIKLPNGL